MLIIGNTKFFHLLTTAYITEDGRYWVAMRENLACLKSNNSFYSLAQYINKLYFLRSGLITLVKALSHHFY